jgi:hypothetical protein
LVGLRGDAAGPLRLLQGRVGDAETARHLALHGIDGTGMDRQAMACAAAAIMM